LKWKPLIGIGIGLALMNRREITEAIMPFIDPPGGYSEAIRRMARAIAYAEGHGLANAIPTRLNNPGDLKASSVPAIGRDDAGHLQFATLEDGWLALYRQLYLIVTGRSRVYTLDMTIAEMGARYAEGSGNWVKNVSARLAMSPDTPLRDVLL
jgi:hypothetical protein